MTRRVALGLGANLGDARGTVAEAIAALSADPALANPRASGLYRTSPVGGVEQPDFVNAVLVADTDLGPDELLAMAMAVEQRHGRVREVRWGPRTLDVDVLALGGLASADPRIVLPHPRAHERAFVLVPWAEVDPDATRGEWGTVADRRRSLPAAERGDVRRIDEESP